MTEEISASWVKQAKSSVPPVAISGIQVVRRSPTKDKGEVIMTIADKIWPSMMKLFANVRDPNGMLMQPSHVRAIALNVAQDLVNKREVSKQAEA